MFKTLYYQKQTFCCCKAQFVHNCKYYIVCENEIDNTEISYHFLPQATRQYWEEMKRKGEMSSSSL